MRVGGRAVYFAGDTDLFDGHAVALGPCSTVALLPIWGWGRTLGERHLNPESAATAAKLARSHHRGPDSTGAPTQRCLRKLGRGGRPAWIDQPPNAFRDARWPRLALDDRLCVLRPGEFAARSTPTPD